MDTSTANEISELRYEIRRLRDQVAELLPYAAWAATNLSMSRVRCTPERASDMSLRIADGWYGEVPR